MRSREKILERWENEILIHIAIVFSLQHPQNARKRYHRNHEEKTFSRSAEVEFYFSRRGLPVNRNSDYNSDFGASRFGHYVGPFDSSG